jgi:hypothetical protein
MTTLKTIALLTVIALTMACGYSSKASMPATAGSMPTIAQLNPNAATAGGDAFNWNGMAQTSNTTFMSGTELTVSLPASAIAAAGTVQVTVTNPAVAGGGPYGGGGTLAETSSAMSFTIN